MDENLYEIINDTTEYIENNIMGTLSLDTISKTVHISKFHLLRIWKAFTTTGIMEYVRKRRIALSLNDLINNNYNVEFISSKYSFGSARSYNRAFKDEYTITPAKWRKDPITLQIQDKFNIDFIKNAGDGLIFFQSVVILPPFSIAGPEYKVDIEENMMNQTANKLGYDFFYNKRNEITNPVDESVYIGFTTVPNDSDKYTIYQPSVKINQNSIIPKELKIKNIPFHKYCIFRYIGTHPPEEISSKTLCEIWKYIFITWMPTVEFKLDETFSFEYIDYRKCDNHYCECDLYFPRSVL